MTALIIKTFADIHEYVSLESEVLVNGIYWLIKYRQNDDGSFSEKSQNNPLKLMVCEENKCSWYHTVYFSVLIKIVLFFLKGAGADVTEKTVFLTSFVMIGIKNALKVPNVNILVWLAVNSDQSET